LNQTSPVIAAPEDGVDQAQASARLLDPGGAPAGSSDQLATDDRAATRCFDCFALVQLAVAADIALGVFRVLGGIDLGGVVLVADGLGGGIVLVDLGGLGQRLRGGAQRQGGSPVPELRMRGSVRGMIGNERPYRNPLTSRGDAPES
jgi:hypothetical protein